MDRRTILKGSAVAAAGLLGACSGEGDGDANAETNGVAAPAVVTGKRTLKLVTTWPKNFPGLGTAPENLARRVTTATEGQLTIKVFAAGELVPAFEAFDAVSTGAADMYHGAEYYWQGKSKAFPFFTSVPFGLNTHEIHAWITHGGGQELWDELSARFRIKALPCANTGNQMGGWYNREITSLEDFKGLSVRMPGLGGEVLRRLGAAAVALPGGEIFQSLQTGAIDATEWVGPWNDLAFGFYRVAKFYYWPGFHEPGALLALGTNLDVWESLTDGQRQIIEDACYAETFSTLGEYNTRNAAALRTLIDEHGVQLKRFPDEVLQGIGEISGQVVKELAQSDPFAKRVYDSMMAARDTGMSYGAISEEAFNAMRRLPFTYR